MTSSTSYSQNQLVPLWRQIRAAKRAASSAPAPRIASQVAPQPAAVDERVAVTAPAGCVWHQDPDSGLSGWVNRPLSFSDWLGLDINAAVNAAVHAAVRASSQQPIPDSKRWS